MTLCAYTPEYHRRPRTQSWLSLSADTIIVACTKQLGVYRNPHPPFYRSYRNLKFKEEDERPLSEAKAPCYLLRHWTTSFCGWRIFVTIVRAVGLCIRDFPLRNRQIIPEVKKLEEKFAKDASLPDGMDPRALEMRAMLEEPIGQKYIGEFAKEAMTQARRGCLLFAGIVHCTVAPVAAPWISGRQHSIYTLHNAVGCQ